MLTRIHISYPSEYKNPQLSRVWMLPIEFKENIVKLLGGFPYQPNSIPIRPGYLTQSLTEVSSEKILACLGRESIEIPPGGKEIHYINAILVGKFEFMMEMIDGAWKFTRIIDIILQGHTYEEIDSQHMVYSIGKWRTEKQRRHDGGPRYFIKYNSLQDQYNDLWEIYEQTICSPEDFKKECKKLDDIYGSIF